MEATTTMNSLIGNTGNTGNTGSTGSTGAIGITGPTGDISHFIPCADFNEKFKKLAKVREAVCSDFAGCAEFDAKFKKLAELKEGWDGEHAQPIDPLTLCVAHDVLLTFLSPEMEIAVEADKGGRLKISCTFSSNGWFWGKQTVVVSFYFHCNPTFHRIISVDMDESVADYENESHHLSMYLYTERNERMVLTL